VLGTGPGARLAPGPAARSGEEDEVGRPSDGAPVSKASRCAEAPPMPFASNSGAPVAVLYTTNAIEALNAKLRSAVRARGHFPTDEAALKLLHLVLNRTEKEWTMPPRGWAMAKAQFAVLFGQRLMCRSLDLI
jgi:putative transposase